MIQLEDQFVTQKCFVCETLEQHSSLYVCVEIVLGPAILFVLKKGFSKNKEKNENKIWKSCRAQEKKDASLTNETLGKTTTTTMAMKMTMTMT